MPPLAGPKLPGVVVSCPRLLQEPEGGASAATSWLCQAKLHPVRLTIRCSESSEIQWVRHFPSTKSDPMFSMACRAVAKRLALLLPTPKSPSLQSGPKRCAFNVHKLRARSYRRLVPLPSKAPAMLRNIARQVGESLPGEASASKRTGGKYGRVPTSLILPTTRGNHLSPEAVALIAYRSLHADQTCPWGCSAGKMRKAFPKGLGRKIFQRAIRESIDTTTTTKGLRPGVLRK